VSHTANTNLIEEAYELLPASEVDALLNDLEALYMAVQNAKRLAYLVEGAD
jgi:hypothetical protein